MAAPAIPVGTVPQLWPEVTAFVRDALAHGRWGNTTAANLAPRIPAAEGGPPLLGRIVAWAPAAAPIPTALPEPACDDRPVPPGGHADCAGNNNPPPVGHVWPPPMVGRNPAVGKRICAVNDGLFHAGNLAYEICDWCLVHIRNQPWHSRIPRDVESIFNMLPALPAPGILPRLPMAQPQNTYTGFLSYLCRACEVYEIDLAQQNQILMHQNPPGAAAPNNFMQGNMMGWPENTCECLFKWNEFSDAPPVPFAVPQSQEMCFQHRHLRACEEHNLRLVYRQQNDIWLRETARHPENPKKLIRLYRSNRSHRAIMDARARRGTFRACRCGNDVYLNPNRPPEVFMCLGCEGVVHTAAVNAVLPDAEIPNAKIRRARTRNNMRLRRARAE